MATFLLTLIFLLFPFTNQAVDILCLAASKNKLPPTSFVTAKINIKWKVAVYGITDPFQGFFTLFPGCCRGTTNYLFWTIGNNWHPGWQSRGRVQKRGLNEHEVWTDLPLDVISTARTKTHSWRTWGNSRCNYFCYTCSLSQKRHAYPDLSLHNSPQFTKNNVHWCYFLLFIKKLPNQYHTIKIY